MQSTRRTFIQSSAIASVCAVAGCTPQEGAKTKGLDVDAKDLTWHKSVCRFCGTGLRRAARHQANGTLVALRGDPEHPTTKGWSAPRPCSCPRSSTRSDRLTHPQIRKDGKLVDASWEEAMELVAEQVRRRHQEPRPGQRRLLRLGPVPLRGELPGQPPVQGRHRHEQRRGQPAALHGQRRRRLRHDLRQGRADGLLRRHRRTPGSSSWSARTRPSRHPVIFDQILLQSAAAATGQGHRARPAQDARSARVADVHLDPIPGYDLAVFHAMAHVIIKENLHDEEFIDSNVTSRRSWTDKPVERRLRRVRRVPRRLHAREGREDRRRAGARTSSRPPGCFAQGPDHVVLDHGAQPADHRRLGQQPDAQPAPADRPDRQAGRDALLADRPAERLRRRARHRLAVPHPALRPLVAKNESTAREMEKLWGCQAGHDPSRSRA